MGHSKTNLFNWVAENIKSANLVEENIIQRIVELYRHCRAMPQAKACRYSSSNPKNY